MNEEDVAAIEKEAEDSIYPNLPKFLKQYFKHVIKLAKEVERDNIKDFDEFSRKCGFVVSDDWIFEHENGGKKRVNYVGRRLEDYLKRYLVFSRFEQEIAAYLVSALGKGEPDNEKKGTFYKGKRYWLKPHITPNARSHILLKRINYKA